MSQYLFPWETLISKTSRITQPKIMKSHIAYIVSFVRYSGPDDAAEVTWNTLNDYNTKQFLQHFVIFWENYTRDTFLKYFYIWQKVSIFFKKLIFVIWRARRTLNPPLHRTKISEEFYVCFYHQSHLQICQCY